MRSHATIHELFQSERARLELFATSILRNQESARDAVQNVFLKCVEIQPEGLGRPYLYQAVRNHCLNEKRGQKRLTLFLDNFRILNFGLSYENAHNLGESLSHLSPKLREVLILRMHAGLKIEEIAETLSVPVGTVKSRINMALEKLRVEEDIL